jgi:hypothetical protein
LQQKMFSRSTMSLMFCPKPIASCTADADWVAETCTAPECTITGAVVEHSTKKFGTYVLHGSSEYVVVADDGGGSEGGDGTSDTKSSAASTLSVVLSLVLAAIVHLCI